VTPGATRSGVVGRHGSAWKLRVTAPPEQGRANAGVVRLLAKALDLREDAISLVSGRASRYKVVELSGLDAEEAARRLERAR